MVGALQHVLLLIALIRYSTTNFPSQKKCRFLKWILHFFIFFIYVALIYCQVFIIMVEVRRVELLSNINSTYISPSAVCYLTFPKKLANKHAYILVSTIKYPLAKVDKLNLLSYWLLRSCNDRRPSFTRTSRLTRQRMLILYYQRLYLFLLFLSGQSSHPLLAISASLVLSKTNTPPNLLSILLYNIFKLKSIILSKSIALYFFLCYYN